MSSAETIAKAFGKARKSGSGWQCLCPIHENQNSNPSLGVVDNPNGGVTFNCLANCDWREIQRIAEDRGLIERFEEKKKMHNESNGHLDQSVNYSYFQEDKTVRYYVKRLVRNGSKSFLPYHFDESGKNITGLEGIERIPYNLPALLESEIVYLTEGEKDADTLIRLNLPATTNVSGAKAWKESYNAYFRNKTVIICQDNDDAGRERTQLLIKNLKPVVKELRLFEPPNVALKGDVTDWINEGGDPLKIAEISTLLYKAFIAVIPKIFTASSWIEQPVVKSPPILEGLFDEGDKVLIVAQSKARKSFFAMQLALSVAANNKFLQYTTHPKTVLIIQFEIKENNYHARLKQMAASLKIQSSVLDSLFILNARGVTRNAEQIETLIRETIEKVKPGLVILDPLYKLMEGDESKIEEVKPLLKFFDELAETSKAAILYVHHDKKNSGEQKTIDRGAGSGVLARDIDCGIYLAAHRDLPDHLVVDFVVRNHVPPASITTEWTDYRFINSNALPEKETKNSGQNGKIKHSQKVEAAIEMIKKEMILGNLEMGAQLFNTKLREIGIARDALTAIKDSLISVKAIEVKTKKAIEGGSNKIIYLTYEPPVVADVVEYECQNESFFDPEDDLF